MARTVFDKEWKDWVRENVERGCSREELLGILVREGFEWEAARRELNPLGVQSPAAVNPLALPNLTRVESPRVELYTAEGFLAEQECQRIISLMASSLRPSTITVAEEPDKYFRRSKTCDLSLIDSPAVRALDSRICDAMQISPALAEPTQGQYYDVGDEFKPHTDYFEAYELEKFSTATLGQRTWTFMMYLNEPEGGGETAFPSLGASIRPKAGRAVIWNNLTPEGEPNPYTLHHGTPVESGYKAIITKWFRAPRRD
jgi:prolyl 4-hydroxylase